MKLRNIVFILLVIFAILIVFGILYRYRDRRTYELNLPQLEELTRIELEQNAEGMSTTDVSIIKELRDTLYGVKRISEKESIQDFPVNVDNEIKINFYFEENKCSTIYVYKKHNKYYIEQPYNGIYRISADEYNSIEKYLR